jgi:1-acyl-sn-glycerol-3-phosphate acyltransferase
LAFWSWTGFVSLPLSVVLLAGAPLTLLCDPVDREFLNRIQQMWASASILPFLGPVDVRGDVDAFLHLAQNGQSVVFVSNHTSVLDPYVLMALGVPMRFVAKREVFYIPLVGWVMSLIGHVALTRGDAGSGKRALDACKERLATGRAWSVVFFAEGSRSNKGLSGKLGEFKIGAFKLATEAERPIVPLSISGTGPTMPAGQEFTWLAQRPSVSVVVHRPLWPSGTAEEMKAKAWKAVYSGL